MKTSKSIFEFEWDKGNIEKNKKHKVEDREAEEVLFDEGKVVLKDRIHSGVEERFILLGLTKKKRLLYIAFTKRNKKIRIISARDINKKEKHLYEETT
ncbi:MAG: BrnT family toxin [Candidatus Levybacteria bacterium]|nr:BrnT family toxin [Candidatus Levybacteria bacterium]